MPVNTDALSPDGILEGYSDTSQTSLDLSDDDKKLISELKARFISAYNSKQPYLTDWEFYRLYLKGEYTIAYNRETGEVIRLTNENTKNLKSQKNVLRPTSRSLVAKLTRQIPSCVVIPATQDFAEQHGALAANALLQYARRKDDFDLKYTELCEFLPWAGNAFLQLYWDRQGGRTLAYCKVCNYYGAKEEIGQPCPQCAAQKQQEAQAQEEVFQATKQQAIDDYEVELENAEMAADAGEIIPVGEGPEVPPEPPPTQMGPLGIDQEVPLLEEVKEGECATRIVDPRDVFIEPGCSDIKRANWICIVHTLPVYEVRKMFPEYAEHIHKESGLISDKSGSKSAIFGGMSVSLVEFNDHCQVYEFHEKPTEEYPKGRVIFTVNDIPVLKLDESPYHMLGRFPLYHFGFDVNCGEFWREPYIAQAWHRQKELNRSETKIREHTELLLNPKILIGMNSRISQDEINADSAQLIKANLASGGAPQILQFPPLPSQIWERNGVLANDIRQDASITESEAGVSGSDPNGRAMAILEAESDQQISPILRRNYAEWRDMHRNYIQLFREYTLPDKQWNIAGSEGIQMFSFSEMHLEDGWDIQIEEENGLARNPAVRLQQALDLFNAGVFMDQLSGQPDIKAFMRHAKLNMPKTGYSMEATEKAAASQIPYMIMNGDQFQPQPEDDPFIFAEELVGWLRGPGRKMNQERPDVVFQVRQIWQYYAMWAASGAPPQIAQQQQQGKASQPGSDQSAPGGSTNNPGKIGTDVKAQAQQQVSNADQQSEQLARQTEKHEG